MKFYRFYVVALLALFLLVPSCKKKSDGDQAKNSDKAPSCTAKKTDADKPTPASDAMVPLDIKLPRPMFVGTPINIKVPNMEKPLGGPRPPFYAPAGTTNVAAGKPVSSSDEEPIIGDLEMITDGDKEAADGSYIELGPFLQHITIDLGAKHDIYAVVLWHYHKQGWVFFDVVVQVSDDPDFVDAKTIFNNDNDNSSGLGVGQDKNYVETNEGKLIDAKGVQGRYVRCYSAGSHVSDMNNYVEVHGLILAEIEGGCPHIVLNLRKVDFMDSATLGMLLRDRKSVV